MTVGPFTEQMRGGRQLRLFDTESGPASAGPAPDRTPLPSPDTDTTTPRTEPQ
ncbi:hypothetical protein [Streptomyces niveiscabiei]|uniref:hypothetical protein n=1 Tax=Streptomyces niveiscabiei TaxID=164115 RepID=UPI0038F67144